MPWGCAEYTPRRIPGLLMQVHTNPPRVARPDPRAHKHTVRRIQHRHSGLIPVSLCFFPSRPAPFLSFFSAFLPCHFFCPYVSDTAPPCSFPASRFIDQTVYLAARTCTVHFRIILLLSKPADSFAASRDRFFPRRCFNPPSVALV